MSRFKIVALILAGMLAIAPAAFAHGGGGHGGGGFHGGGFHGGHFGGYSHFVGGHYGRHGGGHGRYWHGAVGMVALTTVADIGMEARIGGGVTRSVSGTMTTITNRIRPTTPMTRRLTR
jgi:hypothetical protein